MPKITLTEVKKGDPLKVDKLNSSMDSIRTAAAAIDADNVRIEGVDRRNFKATSTAVNDVASFVNVSSGVTNLNVQQDFVYNSSAMHGHTTEQFKHHTLANGIIGPFNWDASDVAIKLNLSLAYTVPGMHDGSEPKCSVRPTSSRPYFVFDIRRRDGSSGSWNAISGTERRIAFNHVASNFADRVPHKGSLSIVHLVDLSSPSSDVYFSPFVTIWYQRLSRPITITGYNFFGQRIRR